MIHGNGETGGNEETNQEPEPPENEGTPIGDLIDDGTIKVGHYVAYTPTGEASYTVNGTNSGTGSDQIINKENLNWRVLDKTEDGKVRLISAIPTSATLSLSGANGYNNGVLLLDELCNTLYKGNNATAKSLKIEDIQNKMNLSVWNYNDYSGYGSTKNPSSKSYPLIFAQEKDQTVNGQTGSLELSEQTSIVTGTANAGSWSVKFKYWTSNMSAANYVENIYYELYHSSSSATYWLSSRFVSAFTSNANFGIRYVGNTGVTIGGSSSLYSSVGSPMMRTFNIRPVVYLESSVKIDTEVEGKDGLTPETAWKIAE